MAKTAFPMKTGSNVSAKVISTLVVLGLLTLVVKDPVGAASGAQALMRFLGTLIGSTSEFLKLIIS